MASQVGYRGHLTSYRKLMRAKRTLQYLYYSLRGFAVPFLGNSPRRVGPIKDALRCFEDALFIIANKPVRPFLTGDWTLGVGSQCDAWHSKNGRLLL